MPKDGQAQSGERSELKSFTTAFTEGRQPFSDEVLSGKGGNAYRAGKSQKMTWEGLSVARLPSLVSYQTSNPRRGVIFCSSKAEAEALLKQTP